MSTTFEQLESILVRDYAVPPASISPDATWEALGLDSLAIVELMWTAEDQFKIKLPPEQADLPTIAAVVSCIDALIAARGAGGQDVSPDLAPADGPSR
ncbi:MAG: phosphopantetheine-binding protein [Rhizobacter sp.]|nr:phosphopantetheine-binding protein [Rhizobacter sp.]